MSLPIYLIHRGPGDVDNASNMMSWGIVNEVCGYLQGIIHSSSSETSSQIKLASCVALRWLLWSSAVMVMAAVTAQSSSVPVSSHCLHTRPVILFPSFFFSFRMLAPIVMFVLLPCSWQIGSGQGWLTVIKGDIFLCLCVCHGPRCVCVKRPRILCECIRGHHQQKLTALQAPQTNLVGETKTF